MKWTFTEIEFFLIYICYYRTYRRNKSNIQNFNESEIQIPDPLKTQIHPEITKKFLSPWGQQKTLFSPQNHPKTTSKPSREHSRIILNEPKQHIDQLIFAPGLPKYHQSESKRISWCIGHHTSLSISSFWRKSINVEPFFACSLCFCQTWPNLFFEDSHVLQLIKLGFQSRDYFAIFSFILFRVQPVQDHFGLFITSSLIVDSIHCCKL